MPPRQLFQWCLQNVMRELTLRSQSKKLVAKESLLWTWNKSKLKERNTFSELSLFVLQVGEHFVFSHDFEQGAFFLSAENYSFAIHEWNECGVHNTSPQICSRNNTRGHYRVLDECETSKRWPTSCLWRILASPSVHCIHMTQTELNIQLKSTYHSSV